MNLNHFSTQVLILYFSILFYTFPYEESFKLGYNYFLTIQSFNLKKVLVHG